MPYKLFYSAISGSQALKHNQMKIENVLEARSLDFVKIDITSDEEQKQWMREHGKAEQDGKVVLPPQLFKDDEFICNYSIFDNAVEENALEELLGIPKASKDSAEVEKEKEDEEKEVNED